MSRLSWFVNDGVARFSLTLKRLLVAAGFLASVTWGIAL